jgi:hypothetical protein
VPPPGVELDLPTAWRPEELRQRPIGSPHKTRNPDELVWALRQRGGDVV